MSINQVTDISYITHSFTNILQFANQNKQKSQVKFIRLDKGLIAQMLSNILIERSQLKQIS